MHSFIFHYLIYLMVTTSLTISCHPPRALLADSCAVYLLWFALGRATLRSRSSRRDQGQTEGFFRVSLFMFCDVCPILRYIFFPLQVPPPSPPTHPPHLVTIVSDNKTHPSPSPLWSYPRTAICRAPLWKELLICVYLISCNDYTSAIVLADKWVNESDRLSLFVFLPTCYVLVSYTKFTYITEQGHIIHYGIRPSCKSMSS